MTGTESGPAGGSAGRRVLGDRALPPDLARLVRRAGSRLRDERWDEDLAVLIDAIRQGVGDRESTRP